MAAAEEQLKQAKSKEERDWCTAELAAQRAELAAQRGTLDKLLDLQKEREARLERLQSQGRATGTVGARVISQQFGPASCSEISAVTPLGVPRPMLSSSLRSLAERGSASNIWQLMCFQARRTHFTQIGPVLPC